MSECSNSSANAVPVTNNNNNNITSTHSVSATSTGAGGSLVAEVDDSPLQKTMDKNKESLKVKLMLRRPINQLIAQGIMPPLKATPAFHEQRQKLERAKMGDLLKAKIQQRPDREELVRQHILEADVGHVDPSLAERQRRLKKARLADSLNDQLSHRPGPLELIKKNILHTEEQIERAVKEGVIPFKATCEGQLRKPQHPDHYITFEDDSQSSEGGAVSPLQRDVLETAAASAGIVTVALTIPTNAVVVTSPPQPHQQQQQQQQQIIQQQHAVVTTDTQHQTLQTFAELCSSVVSPLSLGSSTSSLSPLSSVASPPTPLTPRPAPMSSPAPGKADKNRKKSKTKTQPKTRTIKFHEYKGPPNAHKSQHLSASSSETSYELLLQQQQLFLQWQLEWQHKYPQIILPASQRPSLGDNTASGGGTTLLLATTAPPPPSPIQQQRCNMSPPHVQQQQAQVTVVDTTTLAPSVPPPPPPPPLPPPSPSPGPVAAAPVVAPATPSVTPVPVVTSNRVLTKLEDMKVSDLKLELKKRNLPVSGSKPQLIERLKPFTGSSTCSLSPAVGVEQSTVVTTTVTSGGRTISLSSNPPSVLSDMDADEDNNSPAGSVVVEPSPPPPPSPAHSAMDTSEATPPTSPQNGETIIEKQQRKIQELERELQKSQRQLLQIKQQGSGPSATSAATTATPAITQQQQTVPIKGVLQNGIIHIDPKTQKKLVLQQQLQNRIQQHQLQLQVQQQQKQQETAAVNAKASLAAFLNQQQAQQQLNSLIQAAAANNKTAVQGGRRSIVLGQQQAAIVFNHLNLVKQKNGQHQRATSLPNFLAPVIQTKEEEKPVEQKKNVKSQIVDDVLEILIKNGELPPSAANDPATPTTPVYQATPPPQPPPLPPPLPQPGFAVTLPTAITLTSRPEQQYPNTTFSTSTFFNNTNNLLEAFEQNNFHSNLDYVLEQPTPSPVAAASSTSTTSTFHPNINLKDLGLDLETLDSMDFVQLDGGDENMDKTNDQLINNNPCLKQEMLVDDIQMDMDDCDWLDSLMSTNQNQRLSNNINNNILDFTNDHSCDPLLSNPHDNFDLFCLEDNDFKFNNDIGNSIGWDKVDFAT